MKKTLALLPLISLVCSLYGQQVHVAKWNAGSETMPGNLKAFQENKGQFVNSYNNWTVLYGTDYQGTRILFTNKGVIYVMPEVVKVPVLEKRKESREEQEKENIKIVYHTVAVEWENASINSAIEPSGETPYYFGSIDPVNTGKGIDNIKGYTKLVYHTVYPGVDIEYTFHPKQGIKYAIKLQPGYSTSTIKMLYSGDKGLSLDKTGNLEIKTPIGNIIDHAPVTTQNNYQLQSAFKLAGNEVSFDVVSANSASGIIIDPWTVTPTSGGFAPIDIAVDSLGKTYILGGTTGTFGSMSMSEQKYSPTGSLLWTYNFTQYPATLYMSDLTIDNSGRSYIPSPYVYKNSAKMQYALICLTPTGTLSYFNNTDGATSPPPYGGIYETWNICYSSLKNVLVQGGASNYSKLQISTMNPANGNIQKNYVPSNSSSETSGEIYSGCLGGSNDFYYTLAANSVSVDSIYCFHVDSTKISRIWQSKTSFFFKDYQGKTPASVAANDIAVDCSNVYCINGVTIEKHNINTGATLISAAIKSGITDTNTTGADGNDNGGIAVDPMCNNLYVGSVKHIIVYDTLLDSITSYPAPGTIYDIAVHGNMVYACGYDGTNGFVMQVNKVSCSSKSFSITYTDATCGGAGSATANPSFCSAPYKYMWSNGQTTQTATGLSSGTYTVTVTSSATSVTVTDSVTIQTVNTLNGTIASSNQPKCDSANGSIGITASGGTAPYTYSWNNGATTTSVTNLSAGTYTCTVTDSNGCINNIIYTLSNLGGPAVTFKYSGIDTLCTTDSAVALNSGSPAGGVFSGNGVTGSQFKPSSPAHLGWNYITYTYTDSNGCVGANTDSIFVKTCVMTGIASQLNESGVTIYPNPSSGMFTVQTGCNDCKTVEVYNTLGQLITRQEMDKGKAILNLSSEATGIYCVRIVDSLNHYIIKRIYKQ